MPAVDIMAHSKRSHLNVLTTHHKLHHWQSQLGESFPCLVASNADSHLPASDAGVLWFLHKHSNSSIWNELSFPTIHTMPGMRSLTGASTCGCWPAPKGGADHNIATQRILHGGFSLLQLLNHTGTYGFTYVLYESTPRPIPAPVLPRAHKPCRLQWLDTPLVLLRVDNL